MSEDKPIDTSKPQSLNQAYVQACKTGDWKRINEGLREFRELKKNIAKHGDNFIDVFNRLDRLDQSLNAAREAFGELTNQFKAAGPAQAEE